MSESNLDLSTSLSAEDWTLIKSAPLLAGLLVSLSDLRSGIFGAVKEGLAPSQAIIEAGAGSSNPVVASVIASIKEMAAKRERLQPPISVSGKKPEEVKAEVMAKLAKILRSWRAKCLLTRRKDIRAGLWRLLAKLPMRQPRVVSLDLAEKRLARQKLLRSANWLPLSV